MQQLHADTASTTAAVRMMGDRPAPDQQTDHTADGAIINPRCVDIVASLHTTDQPRAVSAQRRHADGPGVKSPCSFAYGINTKCINNLHYLEEQRLLYPAGQFLVSLSADDGKVCWSPCSSQEAYCACKSAHASAFGTMHEIHRVVQLHVMHNNKAMVPPARPLRLHASGVTHPAHQCPIAEYLHPISSQCAGSQAAAGISQQALLGCSRVAT